MEDQPGTAPVVVLIPNQRTLAYNGNNLFQRACMTHELVRHVFMSYSRTDEEVMQRVTTFLRNEGINVWVDNEKLIPGTPIWEAEIEKAIISAGATVVLLSPDSKDSIWVRRELSYTEQYKKRIFPVLVRGNEDTSIPLRLTTNQYVDIQKKESIGLKRLSTALRSYLDQPETEARKSEEEDFIEMIGSNELPWRALIQALSGTGDALHGESQRKEQELPERVVKAEVVSGEVKKEPIVVKAEVETTKAEVRPVVYATVEPAEKSNERATGKIAEGDKWIAIGLIALGWAIGWGIGQDSHWASLHFESIYRWLLVNIVGGLFTAISLRTLRILSDWIKVVLIMLGWVIGASIGWTIRGGFDGVLDMTVIFTGTIGGLVTATALWMEQVLSNRRKILWIIFAWQIAWVPSLIISAPTLRGTDGVVTAVVTGAAFGALGGALTIWQIRRER